MKKPHSHVAGALIAGGILFYAIRLSAPGRGAVDWIVIGIAAIAVLWNVTRFSASLDRYGKSDEPDRS